MHRPSPPVLNILSRSTRTAYQPTGCNMHASSVSDAHQTIPCRDRIPRDSTRYFNPHPAVACAREIANHDKNPNTHDKVDAALSTSLTRIQLQPQPRAMPKPLGHSLKQHSGHTLHSSPLMSYQTYEETSSTPEKKNTCNLPSQISLLQLTIHHITVALQETHWMDGWMKPQAPSSPSLFFSPHSPLPSCSTRASERPCSVVVRRDIHYAACS